MKKRYPVGVVLLLSALLLFVSMLPLHVSAEDNVHPEHKEGIAVRTEKDLLQMQSGSFYYLDHDITVSQTVTVSGEIDLCLNGKILKYENEAEKNSIFHIEKEGIFRIFDCSEARRACAVGPNGLWSLTEERGQKEILGGAVIGGMGEKKAPEGAESSYFCGGFAYIDGGALFVYGGNIVGNSADYGGAVYLTGEGRFEMHGGHFCGNLANDRGGAIFVQSGELLLDGGSVSENRAMKNGGGIGIGSGGILEMRGGSVAGNTAGAWGGGIENFGMFDMYGGSVSSNTAIGDAGGVYNGGVFTMHGGTVRENAAKYGGGICNDGKMTVHDGGILANLAQESGGGIYNADTLVMNGGKIASNTAVTSGGGIENDGICTMYGGSIGGTLTEDANTAYLGGGVCIYSGSFTMYGGSIEKNTGVDGGGVENEASFTVKGGTISYNYASAQGGGITNRGHLILEDGAEIVSNASGANNGEHSGGGIYWITEGNSSVSVSGKVTVTGNITNGDAANLVVCGKGEILVSGVSDGTRIGITLLNANQSLASGAVARFSKENGEDILALFFSDLRNFELKIKGETLHFAEKHIGFMIGACVVLAAVLAVAAFSTVFIIRRKRNSG